MSTKFGEMLRLVREFRVGRPIPRDLYGREQDDAFVAQLTDGLDRVFASLDLLTYRAVAGETEARTVAMVVSERNTMCHNEEVVALTLRRPGGEPVPTWTAGSHIDVTMPSGAVRQYSLCGDPRERDAYTIAVRLVPTGAGGSREMHSLSVGTELSVTGPRNAFPFVARGSMLFVAGGIGMTAIVPMVRAARAAGLDWRLVYSGRTEQSMPFLDEVSTWESDRVTVRTDAEFGLPTAADLLRDAPVGGAVYCCGPPAMIDVVRSGVAATGATHLHYERFSPPPVVAGIPFTVELAKTGTVLEVPADRTALDVVNSEIGTASFSCRQGFCGTCKTRVLSGTPEHRDSRLTPQERSDHMLICVSRSAGERLVLDL